MKPYLVRRLGLAIAIATAAAVPAQAATTSVNTSMCSQPPLSQPFLSWGDTNWYAPVPGQGVENFDGAGWVLSDGAKLAKTTLVDGATGTVLELPAGSSAVSPTMCVTSGYSSARTMIRTLSGSNRGDVDFSVAYVGRGTANDLQQTGSLKTTGPQGARGAWQASDMVALDPSSAAGWQLMRITLTSRGRGNDDYELYNLYVDPQQRD